VNMRDVQTNREYIYGLQNCPIIDIMVVGDSKKLDNIYFLKIKGVPTMSIVCYFQWTFCVTKNNGFFPKSIYIRVFHVRMCTHVQNSDV
jgi:hypothetical protein